MGLQAAQGKCAGLGAQQDCIFQYALWFEDW